ncbi:MAG: hypothetical protein U5J62_08845 [Desulfurivibrio sp.]|nr:hypothetical protein [Desulfurivibrio sp.]
MSTIDAERRASGSVLRHIHSVVGGTVKRGGPGGSGGGDDGGNLASVAMMLQPVERRQVTAGEVAARWRQAVGESRGRIADLHHQPGPFRRPGRYPALPRGFRHPAGRPGAA